MAITLKIPISKVNKKNPTRVYEIVKETLREDSKNAYTVMGIMVEKFGVKKSDLEGKSWRQWPKKPFSHVYLYQKIRKSLRRLEKEGRIETAKEGMSFVYWWKK